MNNDFSYLRSISIATIMISGDWYINGCARAWHVANGYWRTGHDPWDFRYINIDRDTTLKVSLTLLEQQDDH